MNTVKTGLKIENLQDPVFEELDDSQASAVVGGAAAQQYRDKELEIIAELGGAELKVTSTVSPVVSVRFYPQ